MSDATNILSVVFFVLTSILLALPFYPCWHEWRQPVDARTLALQLTPTLYAMPMSPQLRLVKEVVTPAVVSASVRILASSGSQFQKLTAPTVFFGRADTERISLVREPQRTVLLTLQHAKPWGDRGWRIDGDCRIADAQEVQGPLVVTGELALGADCLIAGDVKAYGSVQVGPNSRIRGALFSGQSIALHEDAQVEGPVVSESHVVLGSGVVIGRPEHPSTLSAPNVLASVGAVVHGTVWASQSGQVL